MHSDEIPGSESLCVEFKSDVKMLPDNDLVDAIVAFANTEGGTLYLGVEDNGEVTGLHKKHRDITQLSAFLANKTVPPLSVRLEKVGREQNVLAISVPKSTSVVAASNGKIQRRRLKADGTPENVPMYPYEINSRLSDLSLLDFSALAVPGAEYADLDPIERSRLRKQILAYHGESLLLELSDEELDKALRFVTVEGGRYVPTYTGLLVLGKSERIRELMPTAEAAFILMQGTATVVNDTFYMPIPAAIEKIVDYIAARNTTKELEAGIFRISVPEYDMRAVREAIVNAFVHRDYSRLGRVTVKMDEDGLSISNPGGFIEGVSYKNILDVEPHGRNPLLADALKRVGLAERSGRGVDRIFEGSLRFGRELPDYSQSTGVSVSLFIPNGAPDEQLIRLISEEQDRTGEPFSLAALFAVNYLRKYKRLSASELSELCNISEIKLRSTLGRLVDSRIVEAVGAGRGREYILSARAYGSPTGYVRQSDIDSLRYRELIMKLVKTKKEIDRADVIELLRVSPSQAYRLLKNLCKEGALRMEGNTRSAKYRENG